MLKQPPVSRAWCVYVLKRISEDNQKKVGQGSRSLYVGMTNNLEQRVREHNEGKCRATKGQQWKAQAFVLCKDQKEAGLLERWLKVGDSRHKRDWLIASMEWEENVRLLAHKQMKGKAYLWQNNKGLMEGFGLKSGPATKAANREEANV